MKKISLGLLAIVLLAGAVWAASQVLAARADRPDCPGQILCPITGEPVCADRCPLSAGEAQATEPAPAPSCCAG